MEAEINIKSDNYIQLKENEDVLRLWIKDAKGNKTGEYLEFDLEDIELPLRMQEMAEKEKQNRAYLRNQFAIIDKQKDHKGKKLFSSNEEAKIKATMEFYKKEVEIFNMFLGDRGVEKLLNGRKLNWSTLSEISEIIEKYIKPQLKINAETIKNKIIKKYSTNSVEKRDDVIE